MKLQDFYDCIVDHLKRPIKKLILELPEREVDFCNPYQYKW